MKPLEKAIASMFLWACLTFILSDPFKWGTEDKTPTHVNPIGWMVFGIVTYFLFRVAIINYIAWRKSLPKRTYIRHSRSHHSKLKGY